MKISTKGRYGLRAVIDLAANCQGENAPVRASVKEIARRQGLSENYLEQLIFPLKKAGILQSVRGAQGGYFLAKPADKITAGEVLRALEGDLAPVECLCEDEGARCGRAEICLALPLWKKLQAAIDSVLNNVTIQDLLKDVAGDPSHVL
ncbi:MAG TPA: Rrf2 family transcriptional regulator [Candidatus Gallacutalibacter stercoravium]|nr:Rrf2 family transcriptional regulator [Candidatus Gallacutalibacter stercoravium]